MDCTNKNCPAYAKCLAPYRGSRCAATRATYGLGDPMTNADRIRAMSDEELAKLFVSGWYDGPLFTCPVEDVECESDVSCDVCFLEWLKAPVEGDG